MKKASKMVEEISEQRKMTGPIKEKLVKKIFSNVWLAIGMILSFGAIYLIYLWTTEEISMLLMKIFAIIFILITVIVFEVAYRKEKIELGVIGIELLVYSIVVLYIPQAYKHREELLLYQVFAPAPVICSIYYVLKSLANYIRAKREYQGSLSDVKEIVRED